MLIALYNHMCDVMTCYIAAVCYVNCVLGYDKICYVNMLHVLSCTFLHEKTFKQKQTYRISSPGPDRENIFLRFRLGNNVFMFFCCCYLLFVLNVFYVFLEVV